ncbi:MAG: superoxide dismutase [Bacteroidaceae bacterium]|nr:superoxide dismutase [Bacteroidaceae bacterium]
MSTSTRNSITGYQMPTLLYPSSALEPVISQKTVEYHFGKHLQTYVDNLNRLAHGNEYEKMGLREIVERAPEGPLLNNAGQVLNHVLYFEQFTPYPKANNRPEGTLKGAINFDFGNFETLKQKMEDACNTLFGSGWVWLTQDERGKLEVMRCYNGDNPARWHMKPLYGIDVWEHAYYLDYQNRRAEHVKRLWEIVDWELVESRMDL